MTSGLESGVIVVGSGAAGGTAALTFAQRGFDVLLLEAGPLLGQDLRADRADRSARIRARQPVQALSTAFDSFTGGLFVDDLDNGYDVPDDAPFHWFRARHLGGRLSLWAGVSLRMSDWELRAAQRDGSGRGWPLSYAELAPHYTTIERYLEVTGGGENAPELPGPSAARSLHPTAGEERLAKAAGSAGLRLLAPRIAQAPPDVMLCAAVATGKVRIRPLAVVSRIELNSAGTRAERVVFVDGRTGREHAARAGLVMLCASTIESIRILLNSATGSHPNGIGNDAGLVGTRVFDHLAGVTVSGVVPDLPAPSASPTATYVPVCHIPVARPSAEFRGGYGITAFVPEVAPGGEVSSRQTVGTGAASFRLWASGEVLPRTDNHVRLSARTDRWGIPVAHIDVRYGDNEHRMAAHQAQLMRQLSADAGFEITSVESTPLAPGSSVHELGGAAMGDSAELSVLDRDNRCWRVRNLLVSDGSCFPSGGWQNPTLTIMALTRRASIRAAQQREPLQL